MSGNVPAPNEVDPLRIVRGIRDLFEGRSNCFGTFTLTPDDTTTVVNAPNCGAGSEIVFSPKTAAAAAEVAVGEMFISDAAQGAFTVTHANDPSADRTFAYRIAG